MLRWKAVLYNICFALNCLLIFLVIFESRLYLPQWVQVAGRMHPLIVHFPIVLLVLTIFWELFPRHDLYTHNHTIIGDSLLLLTAFTAVLSALAGLLLSKENGYTPDLLTWHKWGGILISLLSFVWHMFRVEIRRRKFVSIFTAITCLAFILITGHLGADVTHGEGFISAPILEEEQPVQTLFEDAEVFADMVQPIFKSKCAGCHNEKKAKGELIMETSALLLKGGKSGALWDSSQKDHGLLLRRIYLPLENKKHMPPAGKSQLSDIEIAVISNWIIKGASFTDKVKELLPADSLRLIAAAMFSTIETDNYTFNAADDKKVKALHNNYRTVMPLSLGSPALGVEFFGASQFKADQLKELLTVKEQVVALNLNKMPVTDNDLQIISQFINLRKLNLSFTGIKGNSLSMLKQLKELRQLSLSGTGVDAANLNALDALPNLTQLYIWSTPARSQDLAGLKSLLKNTDIETGFIGDTIKIKLTVPLIENENQVVLKPIPLKLKHFVRNVSIHYTTDGSEPDSLRSPLYNEHVLISKSMTVKAKAFKPGWVSSDIAEKTFFKAGFKIDSITLLKPPDPKYKATGAATLADQQKGDFNFGQGKWLGYREQALEALIYLNEPENISSVTVSTLVDVNSYLMPPQEILIFGGNDPAQLYLIKRMSPSQPTKDTPSFMKGFEVNFKPAMLQYIKIVVKPLGKLPPWHRGKGDKAWAFVDEILLN